MYDSPHPSSRPSHRPLRRSCAAYRARARTGLTQSWTCLLCRRSWTKTIHYFNRCDMLYSHPIYPACEGSRGVAELICEECPDDHTIGCLSSFLIFRCVWTHVNRPFNIWVKALLVLTSAKSVSTRQKKTLKRSHMAVFECVCIVTCGFKPYEHQNSTHRCKTSSDHVGKDSRQISLGVVDRAHMVPYAE